MLTGFKNSITPRIPRELKFLIPLALLVFLNFTFSLQYVNWSSLNISITEVVEEEEEKEEHKNDLFEALVNNAEVIIEVTFPTMDIIIPKYPSDIQTPPPELS